MKFNFLKNHRQNKQIVSKFTQGPRFLVAPLSLALTIAACGRIEQDSSSSLESAAIAARVVEIKDRTMYSSNETNGFIFGKGYWEGFVSLKVTSLERGTTCYFENDDLYSSDDCKGRGGVALNDGLNGRWSVEGIYKRLTLPVKVYSNGTKIRVGSGYYEIKSKISLESIKYEITKYNPIKTQKFASIAADKNKEITTVAGDIPGTKLSFSASLKTYDNFAAGSDCMRVIIRSKSADGKDVDKELTASSPSASFVDVLAPVQYLVSPLCQTSRLAQPANKDTDFELNVSDIIVGDPVM